MSFSYITLQHCEPDDTLDLTAEAVRVTRPGGKIALNYRSRGASDVILLPLGAVVRTLFRIPRFGPALARQRWIARFGWQANRLQPDDVIGPLAPLLSDVQVWRNPRSKVTAYGAETKLFDGINPHHYWVVATVR